MWVCKKCGKEILVVRDITVKAILNKKGRFCGYDTDKATEKDICLWCSCKIVDFYNNVTEVRKYLFQNAVWTDEEGQET
jgi:hypothetical protein